MNDENSTGIVFDQTKVHKGALGNDFPAVLGSDENKKHNLRKRKSKKTTNAIASSTSNTSSSSNSNSSSSSDLKRLWYTSQQQRHFRNFDSSEPVWTTNLELLISMYRDKCSHRILVHRAAAKYYNRLFNMYSIPGAVLGAIGASTVFVSWKAESCTAQWHEYTLIGSGIVMLISLALTTLVAQSQYKELCAAHIKSYRNFDRLLKKLTVELCFERCYRQNVREFIGEMLTSYDHYTDEAELIPTSVENEIKRLLQRPQEPFLSTTDGRHQDGTVEHGNQYNSKTSRRGSGSYDMRETPREDNVIGFDSADDRRRIEQIMQDEECTDEEKHLYFHQRLKKLEDALLAQRSATSPTTTTGAATFSNSTHTNVSETQEQQNEPRQANSSSSDSAKANGTKTSESKRFTVSSLMPRAFSKSKPAKSTSQKRRNTLNDCLPLTAMTLPVNATSEAALSGDNHNADHDWRRSTLNSNFVLRDHQRRSQKSIRAHEKQKSSREAENDRLRKKISNQESHQNLVASLTARGDDGMAISHDHSPSSSPQQYPKPFTLAVGNSQVATFQSTQELTEPMPASTDTAYSSPVKISSESKKKQQSSTKRRKKRVKFKKNQSST